MNARKVRPQHGTPITTEMSLRDMASALGTTKSELCRWRALAELSEDDFETRLAEHRQNGLPITARSILEPVPARGRVQRALGIFKSMTAGERALFLATIA